MLNLVVWEKTNAGQGSFYRSAHELVGVFRVDEAQHLNNVELGRHGRSRSNVWHYAGVNTFRAGRRDDLAAHPVAAAAEYGAEWRSDIAAFLTREAVLACVDHGVIERPYRSGIRYSAYVDPSGGSNDSMTLAISHQENERAMLDLVREVRPPFSPESAVGDFCATLSTYSITHVSGDRYAGEWPREQFAKRNVRYEPAVRSASQLFFELLPAINAGTIRLLQHRRLIDQLINLERRSSFGTGRDTVGHPPGCHDDLAVAVAGSVLMTMAERPQARIGTIDPHGRVHWKDDEPPPAAGHSLRCHQ